MILLINPLQYKPESDGEAADGRTLGEFDPMVWMGVLVMIFGFALLLLLVIFFHFGGWF